ncbi:unnamed protein product [Prorocentrum cordatum]|uniref:Uncharacterized protein n=1 Tax=Prorocentrum cordatum TaxID=2364126 RepID=A0ABN9XN55_9DINO|nr:unnamed protein product [Polarella glacialis]
MGTSADRRCPRVAGVVFVAVAVVVVVAVVAVAVAVAVAVVVVVVAAAEAMLTAMRLGRMPFSVADQRRPPRARASRSARLDPGGPTIALAWLAAGQYPACRRIQAALQRAVEACAFGGAPPPGPLRGRWRRQSLDRSERAF